MSDITKKHFEESMYGLLERCVSDTEKSRRICKMAWDMVKRHQSKMTKTKSTIKISSRISEASCRNFKLVTGRLPQIEDGKWGVVVFDQLDEYQAAEYFLRDYLTGKVF